jgi:membrane-bound lytic murein transglycosylase B
MTKIIGFIILILLAACSNTDESYTIATSEKFTQFAEIAEKSGVSKQSIERIGQMKANQEVLYKISHPSETKPWSWYKNLLLTDERIAKGKQFSRKFQPILDQAYIKYHIPPHYISSILGVETFYGHKKGNYPVAQALATIGFYYPTRSTFFLHELNVLLAIEKTKKIDIFSLQGSYAGAFGMGQFMPDSYQDFAVSAKHAKTPDLINSYDDNILSIGNFLNLKGKWQQNQPCLIEISITNLQTIALELLDQKHILWLSKDHPNFKKIYTGTPPEAVTGALLAKEDTRVSAWLTYPNYHAIKTYNSSDMYALLVHLLAQSIHG